MADRGGYTTHVFVIDCSQPMGALVQDPQQSLPEKRSNPHLHSAVVSKFELAREVVMRKIVSVIMRERKTEHVMVVATGDRTNNPQTQGYEGVDVLFQPATAAKWMVDKVKSLKLGNGTNDGDVLLGLTLALSELDRTAARNRSTWSYEFLALTDASQGALADDLVDHIANCLSKINATVNFSVYGTDDPEWEFIAGPSSFEKTKMFITNEQILSGLIAQNPERIIRTSLDRSVLDARAPSTKTVKPMMNSISLIIGDPDMDVNHEAVTSHLEFNVVIGKKTALVKPPGSKKIAVRQRPGAGVRLGGSQIVTQDSHHDDPEQNPTVKIEQSQTSTFPAGSSSQAVRSVSQSGSSSSTYDGSFQITASLYDVISNPLKPIKKYIVELPRETETDTEAGTETEKDSVKVDRAVEDLTRSHKFGNTWLPISIEDSDIGRFETRKALWLYRFMPAHKFERELEMGEVYQVWANPKSTKSQIEISSLVKAMRTYPKGEVYALFRYTYQENAAPRMMVGKPVYQDGQHGLQLVQVPFADDYRRYWFDSLLHLKDTDGNIVKEHPYLPTDEQNNAIESQPWYHPSKVYNPGLHRVKEAMYHEFTASPDQPICASHPSLTSHLSTPRQLVQAAAKTVQTAVDVFDVHKVVRVKRRNPDEEDEESIDLGEGLDVLIKNRAAARANASSSMANAKAGETFAQSTLDPIPPFLPLERLSGRRRPVGSSEVSIKKQRGSTAGPDLSPDRTIKIPTTAVGDEASDGSITQDEDEDEDMDEEDGREEDREDPISEFDKLIKRDGDNTVFALERLQKDMFRLVQAGSNERALDCLLKLRKESLEGEESPRFNGFIRSLRSTCLSSSTAATNPNLPGFWTFFLSEARSRVNQGQGEEIGLISVNEDSEFRLSDVSEEERVQFLK
ncbi:DNA-binding subunit of a DNA-dependent protein kinase (Ku80 autoantigen) [Phaffia rhodozyma]|uniref:DNA helicase n=1 Tax=Phaffia rhodozyma TaxID=264483 RepID=A0A0F7SQR2_PHARH|nr:DNA-binding subunit of a DNA-dependent protein kinase (Ku80 autoantigen) [Phaffia rhodozyma]